MTQADSHELKRFGITAGLTNYAAAYATGLLAARRLLTMKNMADMYKGQEKIDGKLYSVMDDCEDRRPFKAHLDVGLIRTTTGNRVFGCMKGASDGGLFIPHNEKRFPGFRVMKQEVVTNKRGKKVEAEDEGKKTEYKPEEHKEHILGAHVQKYFDILKKGDANKFNRQFSKWSKCLTDSKAKNIQELYTKTHAAIRAKPQAADKAKKPVVRKEIKPRPQLTFQDSKKRTWTRVKKTSSAVKKERIAQLINKVKASYAK